jgi:hypothetical protein
MYAASMYYVLCPKSGDLVAPITSALRELKVTCPNGECNHTFRFEPEDVRVGMLSRDGNGWKLESFEHLMV